LSGFGLRFSHFHPLSDIMLPPGTFKDRVALVTGGGTGLGKEMAAVISQLGASVAILSRKLDVLKRTAEEISSQTGNKVIPLQADVRNATAVRSAIDSCVSEVGLPTIVINNAAGNFVSPTERLSPHAFKVIVDIDLLGTANVILDVGKRLIEGKKGASFLAVTATLTNYGSGFMAPAAAAKAGVEALNMSLASEWGRYGMRFNCIAPGAFETKGAFSRIDPTGQWVKRLLPKIPTGRIGELREIANLAAYLVSDYASWITGETVTIDGGLLPFEAGSFNDLVEVPDNAWDEIEAMIKKVRGS
jgi:2,4-dienoyl-CoA reductase